MDASLKHFFGYRSPKFQTDTKGCAAGGTDTAKRMDGRCLGEALARDMPDWVDTLVMEESAPKRQEHGATGRH